MPPHPSEGRHELHQFQGRTEELAWLRGMFEQCAARGPDGKFTGPRMAVIVAESGIGKSRLVQELYHQLTMDPVWDPPECDYWPDAFQESGTELRTEPDMTGHQPKGPPRFVWLGARWRAPERNALESVSVIPSIHASLMVHVKLVEANKSLFARAMGRVAKGIRADGLGEAAEQVADLAIPFGGLLSKVAKGAVTLAKDSRRGLRSFERESKSEVKSAEDELLASFREVFAGKGALPSVLWLDDAQWIDAHTTEFLPKLWARSESERWPLLIVATHWEREWRERASAAAAGSQSPTLTSFQGRGGVEVKTLLPAASNDLGAFLQARLPGLEPVQRELVLEKAAGNFLTMVENVGELVMQPEFFVAESTQGALTVDGVGHIRGWESDRDRRVRQRFLRYGQDLKRVLGWSSQLGMRFLAEVVAEFAGGKLSEANANNLLDECVDPYCDMGMPTPLTREFRDRAFFKVAEEYGRMHLRKDAEHLRAVLHKHLIEWVNNSFTEDGSAIGILTGGEGAPARSATGLSVEERRDLLGMAVREFPLPDDPDWDDPVVVAALRARRLLAHTDGDDNLWDRVRETCSQLAPVDWSTLPSTALSAQGRARVAMLAAMAGDPQLAASIRIALLEQERQAREEAPGGETEFEALRSLSDQLVAIGDIESALGELPAAKARYEEALATARRMVERDPNQEALLTLEVALDRVGTMELVAGNADSARGCLEESVELARQLAELESDPNTTLNLAIAMRRLGEMDQASGSVDEALDRFDEALVFARQAVDQWSGYETLSALGFVLGCAGGIRASSGDTAGAVTHLSEAVDVSRRVAEEWRTPEAMQNLCGSLDQLIALEQATGDDGHAKDHLDECVPICRWLAEELGTPQLRLNLGIVLRRLGILDLDHGNYAGASLHLGECVEIMRPIADGNNSVDNLIEVLIPLTCLGAVRLEEGGAEAAATCFEEVQVRSAAVDGASDNPAVRLFVRAAHAGMVDVMIARGQFSEAYSALKGVLEWAKEKRAAGEDDWLATALHAWTRSATCLCNLARPAVAEALLLKHAQQAESYEDAAGRSFQSLDTCADFWEALEVASRALGHADQADAAQTRAGQLRERMEEIRESFKS